VAKSKNLCIFIGNLGRDPEVRYLPSGDALCSFSIACTETWKDKTSGEMKEQTEWIRCSVFGRLAEVCGEYLKQGSRVYVEGKFKTRKYQATDGTDRYTTEIKVEEMMMLDGRPAGEGGGERRERTNAGNGSQRQPQERQGTKAGSAGSNAYGAGGGFDSMDDDIPFDQPYRGLQWLVCA
jgi:single-strand DNA-binding protein